MRFPPNEIETERLLLRRPRFDDAAEVFAKYAQDAEVTRYLSWHPHASLDETRTFVEIAVEAWTTRSGHLSWVIERREDAQLLGTIGASISEHGAAVGYVLARPYWNNGYTTEALAAVCDAALEDTRIHRVWAWCDVENVASARVMEKAGMQREGLLRRFSLHPNVSDVPRDSYVYARVK
jgi:RimJ/RimL family protein N-acetyltransferase